MSTSIWAAAAAIIIAIIGGVWWYGSQEAPAPATTDTTQTYEAGGTDANTPDTDVSAAVGATVSAKTVTVSYTDTGFSPQAITINKGDTVTFINNSTGRPMWVGADEHPTHTQYDSTGRAEHCAAGYTGPAPFDQCSSGSSYSFVFDKAGTFEYHNHTSAQFEGTVTVQ